MKVLQILTVIVAVAALLKPNHYKAIQHEFYQVWDSIDEMRGAK